MFKLTTLRRNLSHYFDKRQKHPTQEVRDPRAVKTTRVVNGVAYESYDRPLTQDEICNVLHNNDQQEPVRMSEVPGVSSIEGLDESRQGEMWDNTDSHIYDNPSMIEEFLREEEPCAVRTHGSTAPPFIDIYISCRMLEAKKRK